MNVFKLGFFRKSTTNAYCEGPHAIGRVHPVYALMAFNLCYMSVRAKLLPSQSNFNQTV